MLLLLFLSLFLKHSIKKLVSFESIHHVARQSRRDLAENASNIAIKLCKLLEHGNELTQLIVFLIFVPTYARHSIFRLK